MKIDFSKVLFDLFWLFVGKVLNRLCSFFVLLLNWYSLVIRKDSILKRIIAGLLAITILFTDIAPVYAAEMTEEVTVESTESEEVEIVEETESLPKEEIETETEDSEIKETEEELQPIDQEGTKFETETVEDETESVVEESTEPVEEVLMIEYLVVNTPTIKATETADVFVGLTDCGLEMDQLQLQVVDAFGNSIFFGVSEITEDGVLFSKSMLGKGTYTIAALVYKEQRIDFEAIGIHAGFGVEEDANTSPDAIVDEEQTVSTEVWTSEGDVIEEQGSLEEALINSAGVQTAAANDMLVIVLDPGHDDTHAGARGNGGEEENLNFRIASYCKQVLDQYSGVKVYMTRKSDACPYPGTTAATCNNKRVEQAKKWGADVFISFHLNASANANAQGAEVYYPNKNYNPSASKQGKELAEKILDNLVELGLVDRGAKIRNSENATKYPDGSLADYYGVIRNSKLNGFPGIIIEHAFISNASDAGYFLSSEEKLQALGVADAQAIIDVYNLKKYEDYEEGSVVLTTSYTSSGKLRINASEIPNVYGVRFLVWSQEDGNADRKWYTAKTIEDVWYADVDLSKHKSVGTYEVHAYIMKYNGSKYLVGNNTFEVTEPSIDDLTVADYNDSQGAFDIIVSGVNAESGVKAVDIQAWRKSNKSDKKTYSATLQEDGTYKATVKISNHSYAYDGYQINVYVTEKNGVKRLVGNTTHTIEQPPLRVAATLNAKETSCAVKVYNIPNVSKVKLAVWSEENGQNDLKWYTATRTKDASWTANIASKNHSGVGNYCVKVYTYDKKGKKTEVAQTTYELSSPTTDAPVIQKVNASDGTFQMVLSNVTAKSGVSRVQAKVWTREDKKDSKTYTAKKQKDGSYIVNVDTINHKYNYGDFKISVFVKDGNNHNINTVEDHFEMNRPETNITLTPDESEKKVAAVVENVPYLKHVSKVQLAVWSESKAKDDLRWYTAKKQADGSWKTNITVKNHKGVGLHNVQAYVVLKNGKKISIGQSSYEVTAPTTSAPTIESVDAMAGSFNVSVQDVVAKSGVSKVQVKVWTQENKKDSKTYTAKVQEDGSYLTSVSIANHKYNYGDFKIEVYVTDGNGNNTKTAEDHFEMNRPEINTMLTLDETEKKVEAVVENVPYIKHLSKVQLAVWSDTKGKDDLRWYTAKKQEDGSWKTNITVKNHKGVGMHNVQVYVVLKNGKKISVGQSSYEVTAPTVSTPTIESVDAAAGTFHVRVQDVTAKSGVSKVQVKVWTQENKKDSKTYTAKLQEDGSYLTSVDIANHKYNYGTFQIQTYVADGNGNNVIVAETSYTMDRPDAKLQVELDDTEANAAIIASDIPYGKGVSKVQAAVWSSVNEKDDLKWYTLKKKTDGTWKVTVPTSNHKDGGTYNVQLRVTTKTNKKQIVGETTYEIHDIAVSSVNASDANEVNGTFTVNADGVDIPCGIKKVRVRVWCAKDKSDLVWYDATEEAEDSYKVYVDIRNHKRNLGTYNAQVYAYANNGIVKVLGTTTCKILTCASTYYNIMGSSAVTVDQLVAYYNANATYPSYYKKSDAPTIKDFCKMYYNECKAEGVKVEVAFCQAMKETGFLRFGGDVSITQYNFAGIGATGGGNPGNSFSSVREGIRAQVQHLKAYASTKDLKNPCVDPRFKYVKRGSAVYVEWLGIKENPYGVGWAAGKNYGYSIKNDYISKLLTY